MSLVGNLEDLGLGDILQIVSLSRKSGVLILSSQDRVGRVVFRDGQVTRATSSVFPENVGDLLLRKGLITLDMLKKAVFVQRNSEHPPRLGIILAEKFGVSQEDIEAAIKGQIETIIYSFFGWEEGGFSFELGSSEEGSTACLDPLQFMLEQGLNPQWLAMEGSRLLDEKRHRGESLEPEARVSHINLQGLLGETAPLPLPGAVPAVPEPAAGETAPTLHPGDPPIPGLLLVDDDRLTGEKLCALLQVRGFQAQAFTTGKAFLQAVGQAAADGAAPLLVIDLIMPRIDGSGILGGLELLEAVRRDYPALTTLLMSDHVNAEAEQRALQLGVQRVLHKPKRGELRDGSAEQSLIGLSDILAKLAGAGGSHYNLGAELFRELGVEEPGPRTDPGPETPGLHLLRGMLQELNNPALGGGIILLVLRFAAELMNRAVIFFVKEKHAVGLGQFGLESTDASADVRVRQMKIPLAEESVFHQALARMAPLRTSLGEGEWDAYLRQQLGGRDPAECFLGPIVSEGKMVAILYGDNLPGNRPIGATDSLEIFLSQAGLAMEKALLERRLRGRGEN
jgi:CheY-like chemotaxis protein